jgi:calcineurin-like phosphoesterase family protein
MTTWFTSDLHIGHKNILKYCVRPWAVVQDMDEALVANWNAVVKDGDMVWDLGDFAVCTSQKHAEQTALRLNGAHHIVLGNHDEVVAYQYADEQRSKPAILGFSSVWEGHHEVVIDGQTIVLCHYALREWRHALRGTWHLFGHTHGLLGAFGKSVDVGVDNAWRVLGLPQYSPKSYRPISLEELKAYMDAQPIGPHPQFGGGFDAALKAREARETKEVIK